MGTSPPSPQTPPASLAGFAPGGNTRTTNWLLRVLTAIAGVWLLREASLVFIPLVGGMFLTMLFWPVRARLSRPPFHAPVWVATGLATLAFVTIVVVLVSGVYILLRSASTQFSDVYASLVTSYREVLVWAQARGIPVEPLTPAGLDSAGPGRIPPVGDLISPRTLGQGVAFFTAGLNTVAGVLVALGLAIAVMVLLLLEVPRWDERLCATFGKDRYASARDALAKSAVQLRRYLLARTITGIIAGGLTAALAWGIGLPLAALWGVLSFVFNYIPNVGILISGIPPTILALATLGPGQGLLFAAGLTAIELITGNLIDPLVAGRAMILSPFESLAGLIFWGWLWGVAGALLSVPLTAALVVALRHIGPTRPLGRFLTD